MATREVGNLTKFSRSPDVPNDTMFPLTDEHKRLIKRYIGIVLGVHYLILVGFFIFGFFFSFNDREECDDVLQGWNQNGRSAITKNTTDSKKLTRCWCLYHENGPNIDEELSRFDFLEHILSRVAQTLYFLLALLVILFLPHQGSLYDKAPRLILVLISMLHSPFEAVCLYIVLLL